MCKYLEPFSLITFVVFKLKVPLLDHKGNPDSDDESIMRKVVFIFRIFNWNELLFIMYKEVNLISILNNSLGWRLWWWYRKCWLWLHQHCLWKTRQFNATSDFNYRTKRKDSNCWSDRETQTRRKSRSSCWQRDSWFNFLDCYVTRVTIRINSSDGWH